MPAIWIRYVLVAFLGLAAFAGAKSTARWTDYTSERDGFRAMMRGSPWESTQAVQTPQGPVEFRLYESRPWFGLGGTQHAVGVLQLAPGMRFDEEGAIAGGVNGAKQAMGGGEVVQREEIWAYGRRVDEVLIEGPHGETIEVRIFRDGHRVFMIITALDSADKPELERELFFETFELIE